MAEAAERKYVVKIVIRGLFGQYSYDLVPKAKDDSLSQLFLLYGENGTGKTTILWLLNHLLSKENGEGHRTFLAHTQFAKFEVHLNDGTVISAIRPNPSAGDFTMTVAKGKHLKGKYDYVLNEKNVIGEIAVHDQAHEAFRSQLPSLRLTVLADDRKVSTDSPVSRKLAWALENVQLRNLYEHAESERDPSALQPALDGFRNWATKRALEGSNLGQRDVNAVYVDLLKRLSRTDEHQEPLSELLERISGQGTRSSMFSRFGLSSEVDVHSIIEAITGSKPSRQQVMAQVVRPYMDSNEARFAALDPLRRILATFVDELNSRFLRNKRVSFDLARGVTIESGGQALDPKVLSSGEKQLLVLFCNVAQASDPESIFIIDEPELSLNVDWQRHLIDALQKLGSGNVQFVLATHSLELLSRHRENVARLDDRRLGLETSPPAREGREA